MINGGGTDTIINIENVIGSAFNDTITGSDVDNELFGGGGADILNGGLGNDLLDGGEGNADRVVFTDKTAVTVNLETTGPQSTGYGLDTFVGIEEVSGGSGSDRLTGNNANNYLLGNVGNDVLTGGFGNDKLEGGVGKDNLTGGAGSDTFIFNTKASKANVDKVTDFNFVEDTISLDNAIFTRVGVDGVLAAAAFTVGAKARDSSDRIVYNKATGGLFYDADGTGRSAAVQIATLSKNLALIADDFLVI